MGTTVQFHPLHSFKFRESTGACSVLVWKYLGDSTFHDAGNILKPKGSCVTVYFLLKQDYEVVDGGDNAAWEKEIEDMLEAEE